MADWWDELPLEALNPTQWEALCDGCGRCCLHKLEDADSGELYFTRVHCRHLDTRRCQCTVYATRQSRVPDCIVLEPGRREGFDSLPATCAYRLRSRGEPLPDWHPLRSGDPDSVRRAGIAVTGRVISEDHVHPDGLEEHIVRWVDSEGRAS